MPPGKYVFVANYSSGSVAVFPVQNQRFDWPADGGDSTSWVQRQPATAGRASRPLVSPWTPPIIGCSPATLGLDKVMIYRLNETNGATHGG